jgi:hypothetical protein
MEDDSHLRAIAYRIPADTGTKETSPDFPFG